MTPTSTEQPNADPVVQTAEIIPFPTRQVAQPVELPHERLGRALTTLNAALAEQRLAIAAWRGALAELKTTRPGLARVCSDTATAWARSARASRRCIRKPRTARLGRADGAAAGVRGAAFAAARSMRQRKIDFPVEPMTGRAGSDCVAEGTRR